MKKIAMLLILLLLTPLFAKEKVIIYCDDSYPPYSYKENNKATGIYTEILEKAFANLTDYEVEIKAAPWKRGMDMIKDGRLLGIYPPYKHPEKRPWIKPYSEPILTEEVILVVKKSSYNASKTSWPKDFYGEKIGLNDGYHLGGDAFHQAAKEGKITKEFSRDNESNLQKLSNGRINGYLNDRIAIKRTISQLEKEEKIKAEDIVEALVISSEKGYIGYSEKFSAPYKNDFIEKVNKEIIKLKNEGTIEKIIKSYQ